VLILCVVLGLLFVCVGCGTADGRPPEELRLAVPEVFYLRPPGDRTGPQDKVPFHVMVVGGVRRTGRTERTEPWGRLTIDARGLEEVVRLEKKGSKCTGGAVVSCPVTSYYNNWADTYGAKPLAAEHSEVGDSGTIRYRLTTADGQVRTARTKVVVGEPVLELKRPETLRVSPGGRVTLPLTVRNTGEVAVDGLGFGISSGGLDPRQRYRNCRYDRHHHGHTAVCSFPDVRIRPGETVTFAPALEFVAPERRLRTTIGQEVWPLAIGPSGDHGWSEDGDAGDGARLRPEKASGAEAVPGTFTDARWISTDVELTSHADFEAVGAAVHGEPGTERRISVGARNNGPGELGPHGGVRIVFHVPPHSSVVKEPMQQIDTDAHAPLCEHRFDAHGNGVYTCPLDVTGTGHTRTVEFTLRLGGPGTGRVSLQNVPQGADNRPENDTVQVTVTR
jgi:hypothetical protein